MISPDAVSRTEAPPNAAGIQTITYRREAIDKIASNYIDQTLPANVLGVEWSADGSICYIQVQANKEKKTPAPASAKSFHQFVEGFLVGMGTAALLAAVCFGIWKVS